MFFLTNPVSDCLLMVVVVDLEWKKIIIMRSSLVHTSREYTRAAKLKQFSMCTYILVER